MAGLGKYLRAKLAANTDLTDIVGSRIYPVVMPQKAAYPAVVYSTSYVPADDNKRQAAEDDNHTVNINVWANDYDQLEAIDDAIRDALDFQTGSAGGVTVRGSWFQSASDDLGDKMEVFLRVLTYNIRVKR